MLAFISLSRSQMHVPYDLGNPLWTSGHRQSANRRMHHLICLHRMLQSLFCRPSDDKIWEDKLKKISSVVSSFLVAVSFTPCYIYCSRIFYVCPTLSFALCAPAKMKVDLDTWRSTISSDLQGSLCLQSLSDISSLLLSDALFGTFFDVR